MYHLKFRIPTAWGLNKFLPVIACKVAPQGSLLRQNKSSRFSLPEYLLDFGPVILGQVQTYLVRATNTGFMPVSFSVDHENIFNSGFFCELDRVKGLPGFPKNESIEFKFTFDPVVANCGLGVHEICIPINIEDGPQVKKSIFIWNFLIRLVFFIFSKKKIKFQLSV